MDRSGQDWTREEVEATVTDYLRMFEKDIRGEPYNKSEHRRNLAKLLDGRSEGAIEYKHQNVSAVLLELGCHCIPGYKPQRNYQELLKEVVAERLDASPALRALLETEVTREARVPSVDDILARMVEPPTRTPEELTGYGTGAVRDRSASALRAGRPDYVAREARNASLGAAGEAFVLNFERARLIALRKEGLAGRVEQVSVTRGDHEGFDVLSFEGDGRERLVEVKTTGFGSMTPFFVTANQVETSRRAPKRYHVYRLYRFHRDPRFFALRGAIDAAVALEATEFRARLR